MIGVDIVEPHVVLHVYMVLHLCTHLQNPDSPDVICMPKFIDGRKENGKYMKHPGLCTMVPHESAQPNQVIDL